MKAPWKALGLTSFLFTSPLFAAEGAEAQKNLEQSLETIKEGSKEAAKSVNAAAEEAGKNAQQVGQKMARTIKAATCPVVGDRKTKLYYAVDSKSYLQILDGQKYFEDDDRACFRTEDSARADGYTRSAN